MDHPVFAGEAFSRHAAWVWMVEHAAWKPGRVAVGNSNKIISVERGQLCYSLRYMATAWRWDHSRVCRFIARVEREKLITCVADTGQTVITICDYDKFDIGASVADTGTAVSLKQRRHSDDTNKKKDKKDNNTLPSGERAGAGKPQSSRRFFQPDEPIDPDFYAMAIELRLDASAIQDEWEKCRDWHLVNVRPTGNAKATYRNWIKKALAPPQPRLALVKA
jgi:hypothetical protein